MLKPYDLSSIQQVKEFSSHVIDAVRGERLDLLINNAGVFTGPSDEKFVTVDNLELTFMVNVVAPFILFSNLLPLLKKTPQSRIINVSSMSQSGRILDSDYFPEDFGYKDGQFSSHGAYSHSKLCMAALNYELSRRITSEEALCNSCDPGTVNTKMLVAGWGTNP
jgi:NAD(P)-dependent dehydrogenase (short-subunit alcohol dehydrogenase family)